MKCEKLDDNGYYHCILYSEVMSNEALNDGDSEWYNTKDTFRQVFGDLSHVEYQLNEKGEITVKECKNIKGEDINLEDITDLDGYWRIL